MRWTDALVEIFGLLLLAFMLWMISGHPGIS